MPYKRYIKRGGKTYGPYIYHSRKVKGKVITEYRGKVETNKKINNPTLIILFSTLIIISLVFLTIDNLNLQGFAVSDLSEESIGAEKLKNIEEKVHSIKSKVSKSIDKTIEANITTKQYGAVLGRPVKWNKNIKLSEASNLSIILPENSKNIIILKAIRENITIEVDINETIAVEENEESKDDENKPLEKVSKTEEKEIEKEIKEDDKNKTKDDKDKEEVVNTETETINEIVGSLDTEIIIEEPVVDVEKDKEKPKKSKEKVTISVSGEIVKGVYIEQKYNFIQSLLNIIGLVVLDESESENGEVVNIEEAVNEVEIEYETPAPFSIEENIENGKRVRIFGPNDVHYENVLAFTELDESLNIINPGRVSIYWVENDSYVNIENIEDKDDNGIYDYVEFIVPILSNQTFDIIVITKAEHLDSNREFISNIFEEVKELDDVWSETINDGEYVRITFETNLTSDKDITVFPRTISGNPRIEIYEYNKTTLIAEFTSLNDNEYNKVFLDNLNGSQDTFDLLILNGSLQFDYIIDPSVFPELNYTFPTLPNGTSTPNTTIEINISIVEANLDEIIFNWNGTNFTIFNDSLMLMMNFENLSIFGENDTRVVDVSGNGNNGTVVGAVVNLTGRYGKGFTFDGIDDRIILNGFTSTAKNYTFSFWIKSSTVSTFEYLFDTQNERFIMAWGSDSGGLGFVNAGWNTFGPNIYADGNWHNLVYNFDGTIAQLFVDGNQYGSNMTYSPTDISGTVALGNIYNGIGNGDFTGNMDEVRILNRSLSVAEIQQLYFTNLIKYNQTQWYLYVNQSQDNSTGLRNANYTYFASAKDDTGNINLTETRTVNVNATLSIVTINFPANTLYRFSDLPLMFNISLDRTGTAWYSLDEGLNNHTMQGDESFNFGTMFNASNDSIADASYVFSAYANDTFGNVNYTVNVSFSFEGTVPTINYTFPTLSNATSTTNTSIEINMSIVEANLDEVIFNWNGTNFTIFNDSLVLMMNFENLSVFGESDAKVVDMSGNGNNGTVTGAVVNLTGKYGKGFTFDGSGDYIEIPHNANLETDEITVAAWVNIDSDGGSDPNMIVSKQGGGAQGYRLVYSEASDNFQFETFGSSTATTPIVSFGRWYYVVGTHDGDIARIFLDGVEGTAGSSGGDYTKSGSKIRIGEWASGSGFTPDGTIDEVRIWNRTLSANEIQQLYFINLIKYNQTQWYLYVNQSLNYSTGLPDATYTYQTFAKDDVGNRNQYEQRTVTIDTSFPDINFTFPTFPNATTTTNTSIEINISIVEANLDEVIFNWNGTNTTIFNDSLMLLMNFENISAFGENDTLVVDHSGYGNNGIGMNFDGDEVNSSGRYGKAISFDGSNDYIDIGIDDPFDEIFTGDFSLETWIKTGDTSFSGIIAKHDCGSANGMFLSLFWTDGCSSGKVSFYHGSSLPEEFLCSANTVNDNEWHHVVAIKSSTNMSIYIDGTLDAITGAVPPSYTPNGVNLQIGAIDAPGCAITPLAGSIDEVAIFNRSLSSEEVQQRYFTNLQKHNQTQWNLYVNQSLSSSEGLTAGEYTYQTFAKDDAGNLNQSEQRTVTIEDKVFPTFNYTFPTLPNATSTPNTSIEINISIVEANLDEFIFNWNGTNTTIFNDSLMLLMNFENISSLGENDTLVVDLSGYGNNGTGMNFDGDEVNSSGRYGKAISFDGSNDYITTNVDDPFDEIFTGDFSLETWIKTGDTSFSGIITKHDCGSGNGMFLSLFWTDICTPGELSFFYTAAGICSTVTVNDNEWHHVVATKDSSNTTIYIDGVLNAQGGAPGGYTPNTINLEIGTLDALGCGLTPLAGSMDEVAVFNRTLSADEVQQRYFTNLQKHNQTQWNFYVNQSLNSSTGLPDETYTYQVFAKNDIGNLNQSEQRTVIIAAVVSDTIPPNVTINAPIVQHYISNSTTVEFNTTTTTAQAAWFTIDSGVTNYTMTNNSGIDFNYILSSIGNGNYTANFYVNDSAGNVNGTKNVTFSLDNNLVTRCGNFTSGGVYSLVNSTIENQGSNCMTIQASNVFFNGNNLSIDGVNTGRGIRVLAPASNVTLQDLNMSDFSVTISIDQNANNNFINKVNVTRNIFSSFKTGIASAGNGINITNVNIKGFTASNSISLQIIRQPALIANNTITNGFIGIQFSGILDDAVITGNVITGHDIGIKEIGTGSDNNRMYDNFLNNTVNVKNIVGSDNWYNTSLETTTNIIGGTNYGGNYWAFPNGTGYSETCTVGAASGICENPVNASTSLECVGCIGIATDEHPLTFNVAGDTTFPDVNISSPTNNTNFSTLGVNINYTVSDETALQACWFTNTSGISNTTITCGVNLTSETWIEGINNITIYANDTSGNINWSSITFTIDTINPTLNITFPSNDSNYSVNNIEINYTITDSGVGLQACWFTNSSGLYNETITCGTNLTSRTWFEGINNLTFYANDTLGNLNNSESVSFTVDSINPALNITSPLSSTNHTISNVEINYTVSDTNLQACWFTNTSGVSNTTINCGVNLTGITWLEGVNNITIYANDTLGNINNSESVNFTVNTADVTFPTIDYGVGTNADTANITTSVSSIYINVSWTEINFKNITFFVFNETGTVNRTTFTTEVYSLNVTTNVSFGNYSYNVSINDILGNFNSTSTRLINISEIIVVTLPVEEDPDTGGSSGGGGGGSSTTAEAKFTLPEIYEKTIALERIESGKITLTNNDNKETTYVISVQTIEDIVILDETTITLAAGESKDIEFRLTPPVNTGIYTGKIIVRTGGTIKEVLILVNVKQGKSLFDISVLIPDSSKSLSIGEILTSQIDLLEVGLKEKLDVTLNYIIKDFEGKTYLTESETFAVFEQKSIEKNFQTSEFPPGDYVLGVEVVYPDGVAVASSHFIIKENFPFDFGGFLVIIPLVLVFIVMLIVIMNRRKKIANIKRETIHTIKRAKSGK